MDNSSLEDNIHIIDVIKLLDVVNDNSLEENTNLIHSIYANTNITDIISSLTRNSYRQLRTYGCVDAKNIFSIILCYVIYLEKQINYHPNDNREYLTINHEDRGFLYNSRCILRIIYFCYSDINIFHYSMIKGDNAMPGFFDENDPYFSDNISVIWRSVLKYSYIRPFSYNNILGCLCSMMYAMSKYVNLDDNNNNNMLDTIYIQNFVSAFLTADIITHNNNNGSNERRSNSIYIQTGLRCSNTTSNISYRIPQPLDHYIDMIYNMLETSIGKIPDSMLYSNLSRYISLYIDNIGDNTNIPSKMLAREESTRILFEKKSRDQTHRQYLHKIEPNEKNMIKFTTTKLSSYKDEIPAFSVYGTDDTDKDRPPFNYKDESEMPMFKSYTSTIKAIGDYIDKANSSESNNTKEGDPDTLDVDSVYVTGRNGVMKSRFYNIPYECDKYGLGPRLYSLIELNEIALNSLRIVSLARTIHRHDINTNTNNQKKGDNKGNAQEDASSDGFYYSSHPYSGDMIRSLNHSLASNNNDSYSEYTKYGFTTRVREAISSYISHVSKASHTSLISYIKDTLSIKYFLYQIDKDMFLFNVESKGHQPQVLLNHKKYMSPILRYRRVADKYKYFISEAETAIRDLADIIYSRVFHPTLMRIAFDGYSTTTSSNNTNNNNNNTSSSSSSKSKNMDDNYKAITGDIDKFLGQCEIFLSNPDISVSIDTSKRDRTEINKDITIDPRFCMTKYDIMEYITDKKKDNTTTATKSSSTSGTLYKYRNISTSQHVINVVALTEYCILVIAILNKLVEVIDKLGTDRRRELLKIHWSRIDDETKYKDVLKSEYFRINIKDRITNVVKRFKSLAHYYVSITKDATHTLTIMKYNEILRRIHVGDYETNAPDMISRNISTLVFSIHENIKIYSSISNRNNRYGDNYSISLPITSTYNQGDAYYSRNFIYEHVLDSNVKLYRGLINPNVNIISYQSRNYGNVFTILFNIQNTLEHVNSAIEAGILGDDYNSDLSQQQQQQQQQQSSNIYLDKYDPITKEYRVGTQTNNNNNDNYYYKWRRMNKTSVIEHTTIMFSNTRPEMFKKKRMNDDLYCGLFSIASIVSFYDNNGSIRDLTVYPFYKIIGDKNHNDPYHIIRNRNRNITLEKITIHPKTVIAKHINKFKIVINKEKTDAEIIQDAWQWLQDNNVISVKNQYSSNAPDYVYGWKEDYLAQKILVERHTTSIRDGIESAKALTIKLSQLSSDKKSAQIATMRSITHSVNIVVAKYLVCAHTIAISTKCVYHPSTSNKYHDIASAKELNNNTVMYSESKWRQYKTVDLDTRIGYEDISDIIRTCGEALSSPLIAKAQFLDLQSVLESADSTILELYYKDCDKIYSSTVRLFERQISDMKLVENYVCECKYYTCMTTMLIMKEVLVALSHAAMCFEISVAMFYLREISTISTVSDSNTYNKFRKVQSNTVLVKESIDRINEARGKVYTLLGNISAKVLSNGIVFENYNNPNANIESCILYMQIMTEWFIESLKSDINIHYIHKSKDIRNVIYSKAGSRPFSKEEYKILETEDIFDTPYTDRLIRFSKDACDKLLRLLGIPQTSNNKTKSNTATGSSSDNNNNSDINDEISNGFFSPYFIFEYIYMLPQRQRNIYNVYPFEEYGSMQEVNGINYGSMSLYISKGEQKTTQKIQPRQSRKKNKKEIQYINRSDTIFKQQRHKISVLEKYYKSISETGIINTQPTLQQQQQVRMATTTTATSSTDNNNNNNNDDTINIMNLISKPSEKKTPFMEKLDRYYSLLLPNIKDDKDVTEMKTLVACYIISKEITVGDNRSDFEIMAQINEYIKTQSVEHSLFNKESYNTIITLARMRKFGFFSNMFRDDDVTERYLNVKNSASRKQSTDNLSAASALACLSVFESWFYDANPESMAAMNKRVGDSFLAMYNRINSTAIPKTNGTDTTGKSQEKL